MGDRVDLKFGLQVSLFGFEGVNVNVPPVTSGTVLNPLVKRNEHSLSRVAIDANRGDRGAPVVDQRGRVLGFFLGSRTGQGRSLEPGALRAFLEKL